MDIAWLRDLVIVIYGILGVLLAVPIFVLIIILYKKVKEILITVEKTTVEAKEVIGTVKQEFVSPMSKVMVVMQTIRQTSALVSEFMKNSRRGLMSDRDTGSFLSGLLVGAVIGVALGLLFAPQSGQETRELVKARAALARERASEIIEKVKNKASADS